MSYMTGKDILLLPDGATYHLGVKKGDIYPRIITVGSMSRALAMSKCFDTLESQITSARQFHIYSGKYKEVGITIIAIGMGAPMMDFMVREASYVLECPMAVIRVGTCGLWQPQHLPGTVVCCGKGCAASYTNYAAWTDGCYNDENTTKSNYLLTKSLTGDAELNQMLLDNLKAREIITVDGTNIAGDFFYSAQGRLDGHFDDRDNQDLKPLIVGNGFDSVEMESFTLFLLARQRTIAPMYVTACHIGILNRVNPDITTNIGADELHKLETQSGYAAMEALAAFDLEKKKQ